MAKPERLLQLLRAFKGKRIIVAGDFMLDLYLRGSASRLSPEAPVPVVHVANESVVPGGAGNVAVNLAVLGADVRAIGILGRDEAARRLLGALEERGVDASGLVEDGARPTSQKCRILAEHQQVVRFDRESSEPLGAKAERQILKSLLRELSDGAQALVLSDYGKGVIGPHLLREAISHANQRGIPVTADPKVEHFKRYRGVTCITPNLQEAWGGMNRHPKASLDDLERLGRDILKTLRARSVLITRGAQGMSLFKRDASPIHIPTVAKEVFDVTGAGDTVISVLTLALASRATLEEASILSNIAAGIVVGKLGTAAPEISELSAAIRA